MLRRDHCFSLILFQNAYYTNAFNIPSFTTKNSLNKNIFWIILIQFWNKTLNKRNKKQYFWGLVSWKNLNSTIDQFSLLGY